MGFLLTHPTTHEEELHVIGARSRSRALFFGATAKVVAFMSAVFPLYQPLPQEDDSDAGEGMEEDVSRHSDVVAEAWDGERPLLSTSPAQLPRRFTEGGALAAPRTLFAMTPRDFRGLAALSREDAKKQVAPMSIDGGAARTHASGLMHDGGSASSKGNGLRGTADGVNGGLGSVWEGTEGTTVDDGTHDDFLSVGQARRAVQYPPSTRDVRKAKAILFGTLTLSLVPAAMLALLARGALRLEAGAEPDEPNGSVNNTTYVHKYPGDVAQDDDLWNRNLRQVLCLGVAPVVLLALFLLVLEHVEYATLAALAPTSVLAYTPLLHRFAPSARRMTLTSG